jgi:hypothetical protein
LRLHSWCEYQVEREKERVSVAHHGACSNLYFLALTLALVLDAEESPQTSYTLSIVRSRSQPYNGSRNKSCLRYPSFCSVKRSYAPMAQGGWVFKIVYCYGSANLMLLIVSLCSNEWLCRCRRRTADSFDSNFSCKPRNDGIYIL